MSEKKGKAAEIAPPPLFTEVNSVIYAVTEAMLRKAYDTREPLKYETAQKIVKRVLNLDELERAQLLAMLNIRRSGKEKSPNGIDCPFLHPTDPQRKPEDRVYRSILNHEPTRPLTLIERQWLRAVLDDPRMTLFEETPLTALRESLADVEPLYRQEDVEIFDACADGDPYADEGYRARFRLILQAIRRKSWLSVTHRTQYGTTVTVRVRPTELEYSEKDDKFRLVTEGGSFINLGRVLSCEECPKPTDPPVESAQTETPGAKADPVCERKTAEFTLFDRDNARDRILFHFAHFERQTRKLDETTYRLTVSYEADDEAELVIRVLSCGPYLRVENPAALKNKVAARLRRQMGLWS